MSLSNIISGNLRNIPGWSSKRHIIVFESDDWGSIRMSSKENKIELEKKGFDFTNQDFNSFDALESNEDLSCLFQVLQSHTDMYGNHPIITAVSIVGNPDFDKIEKSGFKEYYWEPMSETCKRYPEHDKVCNLYKYGISNALNKKGSLCEFCCTTKFEEDTLTKIFIYYFGHSDSEEAQWLSDHLEGRGVLAFNDYADNRCTGAGEVLLGLIIPWFIIQCLLLFINLKDDEYEEFGNTTPLAPNNEPTYNDIH